MAVFFHFGANNEFMFKSQKYLNILSGQSAEDCRPLRRYREQEPNNKYRLPENAVLNVQFLLPGESKKKPVAQGYRPKVTGLFIFFFFITVLNLFETFFEPLEYVLEMGDPGF